MTVRSIEPLLPPKQLTFVTVEVIVICENAKVDIAINKKDSKYFFIVIVLIPLKYTNYFC